MSLARIELDAEGEAGALHGDDDGLAELLARDLPWVDAALARERQAVGPDARTEVGEVEPGREMVADGVDEADPQLGVAFQLAVGGGERVEQLEVGGVALVGTVEADEQDVPAALGDDLGFGHGSQATSGVRRRHRRCGGSVERWRPAPGGEGEPAGAGGR